ncbi:hypothetical protein IPA_04865 [Ignicoccus pacificus DSM 13166]|uniref:Uncharacterized protein n=1 Tax=Ignicoccus pacificus DSM 13166 TaxID=940294 RepID=A0A977KB63_9CREN|nr:hypothetical protein IPA_04865 [Ignicoccus pacificus DSM 13166]
MIWEGEGFQKSGFTPGGIRETTFHWGSTEEAIIAKLLTLATKVLATKNGKSKVRISMLFI